MGNCCRAESSSSSSMIWGGDDWNSLLDDGGEGKRLLDGADRKSVLSSSSCGREIKIRISKKELEKLVQKIEAQGLSLQQVLRLLSNKNTFDSRQLDFAKCGGHRSWRPALQSIPEGGGHLKEVF